MTHSMRWESDGRDLSRVVLLFGLSLLLAALPARGMGAEVVAPQTLFELPYGSGESQIGVCYGDEPGTYPMGPTGLVIGPSGDVYIGDYVQRVVKRFDRTGKLLMTTEGTIENMGLPSIGPRGEIAVISGANAADLTMFAPDGKRVVSTRDEKGGLVEPRGGEHTSGQIGAWKAAHSLPTTALTPSFLYYDADGRFYVGVTGSDFEPKVVGARSRVFVFTPALELSAVVLGDFVDPQGRLYSSHGPRTRHVGQRYEVRGSDGSLLREADVPSSDTLAEVLPWMGGDAAGVWYVTADATGDLYLVDAVTRSAVGGTPRSLTEHLRVTCDLSVVRLDATGELLAAFRLPGSPFLRGRSVYIDPKGDVYYFEFGPKSLKVDMISAASLSAKAAKSPSKIVTVQP